ncbi:MAG: helix-turn-helix domain-containing protein [Nannocystaceae bacterium]
MTTKPRTVNEQARAIVYAAAGLFNIPPDAVMGERRDRRFVRARHAVYLAVRRAAYMPSFPDIGEMFGRDHSTIYCGVKKALERERDNPWFAGAVAQLVTAGTKGKIGPPLTPRRLGQPANSCPHCHGHLVAPFVGGRRQCNVCERYEPRGMAAREMRRAG